MDTHGRFDWTHMCLLMVNQSWSSNVPAAMVRSPGRSSAVWDTVVPHFVQKFILSHRPLTSE